MALGQVSSMAVALLGDINDFTKKMDTATGKVSAFDKSVAKMGSAVTKAAKAAAVAAAAAVTAYGVSAVKTFADFDTSMRQVFTLMPDLSAEAKDVMIEDVMELSEAIDILPSEIIPALYQAISAGIPRDNVFSYLEVAGEAAIGGAVELEGMVVALAQVMNAYGAEVDTARSYSDMFFSIIADGLTTMEELSSELFKVAPVAADVGIAFSGIAGWMAELTSQGVPAAEAASYMKVALNELSKAGTIASDTFEKAAGVTFPEFIRSGGDIVDAFGIIDQYAQDSNISVKDMFGSIEAGGAVLMATGVHFDSFSEKVGNAEEAAGKTTDAYTEMAAGIQKELDGLAAWWERLQIDIGGDLTENLRELLGWLEDNREAIGDGIKAIFDGLIDGLQWMTDNADTVKAGLVIIAAGFTALFIQANPVLAVITGIVAALMWFDSTGGVANAYDGIQDVAQSFRDVAVGGTAAAESTGELGRVLAGYFESLGNRLSEQMRLVGVSQFKYFEIIESVRKAQQQALDALEEGVDFDVVVNDFKAMSKSILAEAGVVDEEVLAIVNLYTDSALAFFKSITVSAEESSSDVSDSMDVVADSTVLTAQMMTGAWGIIGDAAETAAGDVETAVDDIDDAVVGLGVGMTQVMRDVIADEMDRLVDEAEKNAQEIRDIISSSLADTLWELGKFHRKSEDYEEDHQRRMASIIEDANDRLADINKTAEQRREDAQIDYDRKKLDIDTWYLRQIEDGAANTNEKRLELEREYARRIEDAKTTLGQKLADIETALTRATEDNTEDRIQASDDELEAYEENIPKMGEIIKNGFESMANSIMQSGLDKAADWAIEQLWNIATEAQLSSAATSTSLGAIALPLTAIAGALLVISDIFSGKSKGVQALNKWLTDLIYGAGTYDDRREGFDFSGYTPGATIQGYAEGGVVPGPVGAPQMAIVHGGEQVLTPEQQIIDYEMLGNAVAAGVYDAMSEVGSNSRPIIVQLPDGTKIAQKLYEPLQRETERRGGVA